MPIHFEFEKNYKFPNALGLNTYMAKSKNPVVRNYFEAIIANGEEKLGFGLAAVVYLIGKKSVCYMTTDADKHTYLSRYLGITDEKMFPVAEIKITSWDTEKDKLVYIFGAERLFLIEDLAQDKRILWQERIDRMMFLYRELRRERGKEILIVRDPSLFVEFCDLLVKKDSSWEKSLKPLKRWSKQEGHIFPDVLLDLKSANVLFRPDASLAYIADPLSHTASASILREEMRGAVSLSMQKKRDILELMTDFLTENMSEEQFRIQLNDITS